MLIKSIALAVPTYPMHCFKFPNTLCKEMDSLIAIFWWGQKEEKNNIHWKSWAFLGLPKKVGGMGFRNLLDFNIALLAKQVWRLLTNPDAFWVRVSKRIYYPNTDILNAGKGFRASWAWGSLLEGKALIVEGARWQVGNGNLIDLWKDSWLTNSDCGYLRPSVPIPTNAPATVAGIINRENHCWNLDPIKNLISDEEQLVILKTTIGNFEMDDHMIWPMTKFGSYTVRSGYNFFHTNSFSPTGTMAHSSHRINERVWRTLWNTNAPPPQGQELYLESPCSCSTHFSKSIQKKNFSLSLVPFVWLRD